MIVVDNDVISDFWIRMDVDRASYAFGVREKDDDWRVPRLWRSEFRTVLRGYMAGGYMTLTEALDFAQSAEAELDPRLAVAMTMCPGEPSLACAIESPTTVSAWISIPSERGAARFAGPERTH
jgi:hypothetical protein